MKAALMRIFPGATVVKAGSYGKKTFLQGRRELDIVAYLSSFSLAEAASLRAHCLVELKKFFPSCREKLWALVLTCDGVSVDVLLTGVMQQGPLGFISLSSDDRLSCSMAKTQLLFFKAQPEIYQDCVRMAKHWRSTIKWADEATRPSSYLLELLMLQAFQSHSGTESTEEQSVALFLHFLESLCNYRSLYVIFALIWRTNVVGGFAGMPFILWRLPGKMLTTTYLRLLLIR
ncbi:MAG: hypothetical protein ACXV2C_01190 [Candidatus Bathyarchaeia archaeon]